MKPQIYLIVFITLICFSVSSSASDQAGLTTKVNQQSTQRKKAENEQTDYSWSMAGYDSFISNVRGYGGELESRGRHFGFGVFANTIDLSIPNTDLASTGVAYGAAIHYRPFPFWYVSKYNLVDFGLYSNFGVTNMKTKDGFSLPTYGIGYIGIDFGYSPISSFKSLMLYSKVDSQFLTHSSTVLYLGSALWFGLKLNY